MINNYSSINYNDNDSILYNPMLNENYMLLNNKKQIARFKKQNEDFYKNINLINAQGEYQEFTDNTSNNSQEYLPDSESSKKRSKCIQDILKNVKDNNLLENSQRQVNNSIKIEEYENENKNENKINHLSDVQILIIGILIGITFIFLVDIISKINRKFK
jgi:hypothetical protein